MEPQTQTPPETMGLTGTAALEKELGDVRALVESGDKVIAELRAANDKLLAENARLEQTVDHLSEVPDGMVTIFRAIYDQCDGKNPRVTQRGEIFTVDLPGVEVAAMMPEIATYLKASGINVR